ncbi:hypothetical protein [Mycobacterium sp. shizuoka-1]|uniref:hypothetical protein n=1 Tax=Mycobacterium sp. shizuoka-1 TaxID=2039281 RepID=UPI000C061369|nr:hypothetical protein [Mycobacterium sp. shizuoka-1]GAY15592.1 hypothetical protein MSZK_23180 [Mycobacterium sp. shizuoka-1]
MRDDPVAQLKRWEDAGAHWAVLDRHAHSVTVALYRCDGGEEVDRFSSADPALLAYVRERDTSW